MISKSFLKSSLIYTVVGALPLATSVILLPFYSNSLNTSDFGQLAIYISLSLLIQIIANFGLDAAIGYHYFDYRDKPEQLKEYVWTVVTWMLIIGGGIALIGLLLGNTLFDLALHDDQLSFFPYGFMSVVTGIFNTLFKTYSNLLINQQRPIRFMWVSLFNFVITIAISLGGLYLYPGSLVGPMWGRFLSGVAIFLLALYFFAEEFGYKFTPRLLYSILPFCVPLLVFNLMTWVLSYIDRYIISNAMEARDVGVFDFAAKCALIIEFIQSGLAYSIGPKVFLLWKEKPLDETRAEVGRYYSAFTAINLLMIPTLVLAFPIVIPWIVHKAEYYDSFAYIQLLCVAFLFRVPIFMYSTPFYFFKKTRPIPVLFSVIGITQGLVSYFLIHAYGLYGATAAILIVRPLQALLLYLWSRKIYTYKINPVKLFLLPAAYLVLVLVAEIFFSHFRPVYVHAALCALVFLLVGLVYRKELSSFYSNFRR
jgi:O-antigen/teichoic acid export membrane protein